MKNAEEIKRNVTDKEADEQNALHRIPNQSILSDYISKVEEKTGEDTEYYAIRVKDITEFATYEHVRISEMDKEIIPRAVLYVQFSI